MKVKNIKSFIEFYNSMQITTSMTTKSRLAQKESRNLSFKKNNSNLKDASKFSKLTQLQDEIKKLDCNLKDIATNLVFSDGNNNSEIMFIGEAPGAEEDRIGKPFKGEAGKLLDKMLGFIDLDRDRNFYISNILYWRPPGNRTPNLREIAICLPSVKKHIHIIKPKILILLGGVACKTLLNTKEGITKLRGKKLKYHDEQNQLEIDTRVLFHPAYLLRNPIEKKRVWNDLLEISDFITEKKIKV